MFRTCALRPVVGPAMIRRAFTTSGPKPDVAKLTILGRVGADPEFQTTPNGNNIVKYSVGTSFGVGDARRTSWWRIACFEERQRQILESVGKGSLVYVEADIELKIVELDDGRRQTFVNLIQKNITTIFRKPIGGEMAGEAAGIEGQSPVV